MSTVAFLTGAACAVRALVAPLVDTAASSGWIGARTDCDEHAPRKRVVLTRAMADFMCADSDRMAAVSDERTRRYVASAASLWISGPWAELRALCSCVKAVLCILQPLACQVQRRRKSRFFSGI